MIHEHEVEMPFGYTILLIILVANSVIASLFHTRHLSRISIALEKIAAKP